MPPKLSLFSFSAHQDPSGQIYESGPIKDCVLSSKRVTETEVKVPWKRKMLGDGVQDTLPQNMAPCCIDLKPEKF